MSNHIQHARNVVHLIPNMAEANALIDVTEAFANGTATEMEHIEAWKRALSLPWSFAYRYQNVNELPSGTGEAVRAVMSACEPSGKYAWRAESFARDAIKLASEVEK